MLALSPLAPARFPELPPIDGVRLAGGASGIRYQGRRDLMLALLDPGTTIAGVLTRSLTAGAPVEWCRAALKRGKARAIVVNSGNSNTFTGRAGRTVVEATAAAAAKLAGCPAREVFICSTGVIGEPPPGEKIIAALPSLAAAASATGWSDAAQAILTTDTFPKGATRQCAIDGVPVTINGFAKGSGMIAPDMATMLAFVATDAAIAPAALQALARLYVHTTFNAVTVDGDRSTNDTLLLFATGQAPAPRISRAGDARLADFRAKLEAVLLDLAQQLVRDGEGATKFVKVTVSGAASAASARKIARTICESPLVKTAFAGEDANWGRIVMAAGRADEPLNRERMSVKFGDLWAARDGRVAPDYSEAKMSAYMKGRELEVAVDVGVGRASAVMWTCDLTHGYISINGDYRS